MGGADVFLFMVCCLTDFDYMLLHCEVRIMLSLIYFTLVLLCA